MSERIELNRCARCGEDAIIVEIDGKYFARVRRFSKCKNYRHFPRKGCAPTYRYSDICKTELRDTPEEAAGEWRQIATPDADAERD